MKLPRWLFLGLLGLILLSPIAAVCIWWITWPERTARQFVALLGEGQLGEAHELMNNPSMMKVTKAERGKVRVRWAPAARITNNGENE